MSGLSFAHQTFGSAHASRKLGVIFPLRTRYDRPFAAQTAAVADTDENLDSASLDPYADPSLTDKIRNLLLSGKPDKAVDLLQKRLDALDEKSSDLDRKSLLDLAEDTLSYIKDYYPYETNLIKDLKNTLDPLSLKQDQEKEWEPTRVDGMLFTSKQELDDYEYRKRLAPRPS